MVKRISAIIAALSLALGLSLIGASPALAEGDSNSPSFYQTPGTNEVCQKFTPTGDVTTWSLSSVSLPAGMVWTKVIIKAGNTGAGGQGPEDHGYYTDATYKYPAASADLDWVQVSNLVATTFSHPSGKNISHAIYCYAPAPAIDVAGSASPADQTCANGTLVGGSITVVITTGVFYTIKDASNATVPFDAGTGVTGALAPGSYTVLVSATAGYHLTSAATIPLTIAPYNGDCSAPVDVAGAASQTDQVCTDGNLVGGVITVTITPGVSYVITDSSNAVVPFDAATGKTGTLAPGTYSVAVTASSGYHLTSAATIPLTIAPYGDDCVQLDTHPLVDPSAAHVQMGCNTAGSYTLTSDQQDPASVVWTVNGSVVAQGTYSVPSAGHFVIDAAPGPGFGFAFGTQSEWIFDFGTPTTCDLKTLALTGSNPDDGLLLGGFVVLFGLALLRVSHRIRMTRI